MRQYKHLLEMALFLMVALALLASVGFADKPDGLSAEFRTAWNYSWDFEHTPLGGLPAGWKVEATGLQSPLARWEVKADPSAHSGSRVLALTETRHRSGSTFNLCWNPDVQFLHGEIRVWFRPVSGRIDQGGGIMWRVQDRDNYYIARFNPLEDNFRIYYVKNGRRHMIESADVRLEPGRWHSMTIVQAGARYECFLDGKRYLAGTDSHFGKAGGVGLWTKADAVTSFDDFQVKSEERGQ